MAKDFRYVLEGQTVEAFQMTEETRYREKDWPEWMNSRYLLTYEGGEQRLKINEAETVIPKFGWIIKYPDNSITAVGYEVMETAAKVVEDVVVVHPEAPVDEEGLLELASKISGKSVDELRQQQEDSAKSPPPAAKQAAEILGGAIDIDRMTVEHEKAFEDLLNELKAAYSLALTDKPGEIMPFLRDLIGKHVNWCACPPGQCLLEDEAGWGCRQNSPLSK